jgi:hypothetical protein
MHKNVFTCLGFFICSSFPEFLALVRLSTACKWKILDQWKFIKMYLRVPLILSHVFCLHACIHSYDIISCITQVIYQSHLVQWVQAWSDVHIAILIYFWFNIMPIVNCQFRPTTKASHALRTWPILVSSRWLWRLFLHCCSIDWLLPNSLLLYLHNKFSTATSCKHNGRSADRGNWNIWSFNF